MFAGSSSFVVRCSIRLSETLSIEGLGFFYCLLCEDISFACCSLCCRLSSCGLWAANTCVATLCIYTRCVESLLEMWSSFLKQFFDGLIWLLESLLLTRVDIASLERFDAPEQKPELEIFKPLAAHERGQLKEKFRNTFHRRVLGVNSNLGINNLNPTSPVYVTASSPSR